eukprot:INCI4223.1.p1 GENE.INCI4223.1~~INCI4223.1.p1  ORF type:complete len:182 (+),score=15.77 INCI4223.1:74-619(+)
MAESCLAFRPQFNALLEQCVNNSTTSYNKLDRLQYVSENSSKSTHTSCITDMTLYIALPLLLFEIVGGCDVVCCLLSQVRVQKVRTLICAKWTRWRAPMSKSPKVPIVNENYQQHKTAVYAHSEPRIDEEGPHCVDNSASKLEFATKKNAGRTGSRSQWSHPWRSNATRFLMLSNFIASVH